MYIISIVFLRSIFQMNKNIPNFALIYIYIYIFFILARVCVSEKFLVDRSQILIGFYLYARLSHTHGHTVHCIISILTKFWCTLMHLQVFNYSSFDIVISSNRVLNNSFFVWEYKLGKFQFNVNEIICYVNDLA